MTPERWHQVRQLLADVLDAAPADRVAVLDTACGSDPTLRRDLDHVLTDGASLERLSALPRAGPLSTIVRTGATADPPQNPIALEAGTRIGPYEVVRLLGAGGMGEVYLARDTRLYRSVALKCVARRIAEDPVARARTLREARAAACLTHPGIAHVYDVLDHHDGSIVIVMEYVEGRSLAARLTEGPCGVEEAAVIAITIAAALEHAHAAGVIHCDIKPANIQLTRDGSLKILDFGIAHSLIQPADATTSTMAPRVVAGTPGYMSPEQALGLPLDGRSDIFSVGVVLFEMLAGERPFASGQRWLESIHSVLADEPSLGRIPSSVSERLRTVIARALRREPTSRFQTAGELRKELENALGLEQGRHSDRGLTTIIRRVAGRRALGAAAASVLIAALAGVAWRVTHPPAASIRVAPQAERWYVEGVNALQEGAYLQATRALDRAVKLDDGYPLSWARLGEAQLELDQEPAARQSLLKASSLVPDRSRLPPDQRLSLEAAMAMASRDSTTALRAYSDLATANPGAAPLFIDLGRVHEAMNATAKAVESYQRAADLDPENPAPFLRLGILQGRNQDVAAAERAFARAEELYLARGRTDGQATVAYERGVMFDRFNRTADAIAALQKARQLAESVDSPYLRAAVAFKMSAVEGGRGNYAAADTLAAEARTLSEPFAGLHAFGLVDVGNVSIYAGHRDRAEKIFREAVEKATRAGAPRAEARARLALAGLLISGGNVPETITHASAALRYYEQTGFASLQARARTILGAAQAQQGDLAGAQATYEALLASAVAARNESEIAQQHYSLAGVLLKRELYLAARTHCDESLARYRALKSPYDIVHSSLRRAEILWRIGRNDEAERELAGMFEPQSGMGAPTPALELLRSLRIAIVALGAGDASRAARIVRAALDVTSEALTSPLRADFERVLALALARSGRATEAWPHAEVAQALAAAVAKSNPTSDWLLTQAEVLLRLRRYDEALAAASALAEQFAPQGRRESAWMASRLASHAAAALRREADAARWRSFADAQWAQQISQFDPDALRHYERRADLKLY